MFHRFLALAALTSLLASVPSWAVTLEPFAWASAGYVPGPDGETSGGSCADVSGLCPPGYVDFGPLDGSSRIQIDLGPVSLGADAVSRISGNQWTFGWENVVLDVPADLTSLNLSVFVDVSVQLEIPDLPGEIQFPLVAGSTRPLAFETTSALVGSGILPSLGSVSHFLPGDVLTLRRQQHAGIYVNAMGNQFAHLCGRQVTSLADCGTTVSLFHPTVPEPMPAGLLGLGALALLGGYRKRAWASLPR
ncbi:MAG: hypothetical protein CL910_12800 [Deltaproteobacteria bacterium]|nr:hypothetical protein [Deltaproteobacteria bacterium]